MFTTNSFDFLAQLTKNNNKTWFEENRSEYEKCVLMPCKELVKQLALFILTIDENLETNPVINKSLTTIHRDLRFSKTKLPFKNRFGINFKKKTREWKKYPAFFFRIDPDGYYFGLTVMKNDPNKCDILRREIDDNPQEFKKVLKQMNADSGLNLWGQEYKKYSYAGKDKDLKAFYNKKNLYLSCFRNASHFRNDDEMVLEIQKVFGELSELYAFLNQIFLKQN